jgi:hypothetical protein
MTYGKFPSMSKDEPVPALDAALAGSAKVSNQ